MDPFTEWRSFASDATAERKRRRSAVPDRDGVVCPEPDPPPSWVPALRELKETRQDFWRNFGTAEIMVAPPIEGGWVDQDPPPWPPHIETMLEHVQQYCLPWAEAERKLLEERHAQLQPVLEELKREVGSIEDEFRDVANLLFRKDNLIRDMKKSISDLEDALRRARRGNT